MVRPPARRSHFWVGGVSDRLEWAARSNPAFTVSALMDRDDPTHRTQLEPILEDLRDAGVPEG